MSYLRIICSLLCALVVAAPSSAVRAESSNATRAEAAERFDRALRLVNAGDLRGGLAEFHGAYALTPSPVLLYNLGLVYAALQQPVQAARALAQALARAQTLLRDEVAHAAQVLREQRDQIGEVEVHANVKQGSVAIDNVELAKLPLSGPIEVAAGLHTIGVIAPGHAPARREVMVASHQRVAVALELVTIEGLLAHLAVTSRVPAADVFVDGERVGRTPLASTVTVAPGTHVVEVKRTGYLTSAHTILLSEGARGELRLDPRIDPAALALEGGFLEVAASESQAVVEVDGDALGLLKGALHVPAGPHRIRVERGGFLPAERDVDVPRGGATRVSVVFEPTPETRAAYVSAALRRRRWAWLTFGAGWALGAGGAALAIIENSQLPQERSEYRAVEAEWTDPEGRCNLKNGPSNELQASCAKRLNDAHANIDVLKTGRAIGWAVAGVGGALVVTGAILLWTANDPHQYDESPVGRRLAGLLIAPQLGPRLMGVRAMRAF